MALAALGSVLSSAAVYFYRLESTHLYEKSEAGFLWIIADVSALLWEFYLTGWASSSTWCGRGRTT